MKVMEKEKRPYWITEGLHSFAKDKLYQHYDVAAKKLAAHLSVEKAAEYLDKIAYCNLQSSELDQLTFLTEEDIHALYEDICSFEDFCATEYFDNLSEADLDGDEYD